MAQSSHTSESTTVLHLYKSLDTLKILTFWKILEDKNACLLDFDYHVDKKYTDNQKYEIEQTLIRLYDEFFVLRDNKKSKSALDKGFEELRLDGQIFNIYQNKQFLEQLKGFEGLLDDKTIKDAKIKTYDRIKGLDLIGKRIKIKYDATIEDNVNILDRVLSSLENTKNLNSDTVKKVIKEEKKNVYEVVASVEDELNRTLPIEDIVCSRWIVYENQALNKIRARKKDG